MLRLRANGRSSILLLAVSFGASGADICAPTDVHGAYGFQLDGSTRIPGADTPIASVGRLVFDGTTEVSGVSSVNFNGLFLGNPVTGKYEFQADCTLTLHLQDTSGAYQNLTGRAAPGGNRVELHQTDPDTNVRGLMVRSSDGCQTSGFQGKFNFAISGHATPFTSESARVIGSAKATVEADGAGNLVVYHGNSKTSGSYKVDSDCFVEADFGLADGDNAVVIKLRGILVNGGKEVLAADRDPELVAAARLSQ